MTSSLSFSLMPSASSPYERNLVITYCLSILFTIISAARIVALLVQIELNKALFVDHKLDLTEEAEDSGSGVGGKASHVNTAAIGGDDEGPDGGIGARGSHRLELEDPDLEKSNPIEGVQARRRRVPRSFVLTQMGTVGILTLLIYVVLVTSAAKWYYTLTATLSVMLILLRYPIGEELRRNRYDRILRIASLVCVIAALLSSITFIKKTLDRGEIYEGPARIVGYDSSNYGNDAAESGVTRTDLSVSWGKEWGCPLSNGRVCQSQVKGALCEAKDEEDGGRRMSSTTSSAKATTNSTSTKSNSTSVSTSNSTATKTNSTAKGITATNATSTNSSSIASENEELKKENEQLQEEIQELKNEEESEKSEESEEIKDAEEEETELVDEIIETEDEEGIMYEEGVEDGIEEGADAVLEGEDINSLEEDVQEDVDIMEVENSDEEKEDKDIETIEENAIENNEDETKEEESLEETMEVDEEKEEEDVENVEEQYSEKKGQSQNSNGYYGEEGYEEEEENESYSDDAILYEFEDDYYENEYWSYDWSSVWGEYGCQDLFDNDMSGQIFDDTQLPGTDDWPFLNIYGNCKTCEAYILDYFAEEAFEKVDHFRVQAIAYFGAFLVGTSLSFIMYLKHLASPAAENTVELLSSDGGVIA